MSHWRPGLIQGREWGSHAAGARSFGVTSKNDNHKGEPVQGR